MEMSWMETVRLLGLDLLAGMIFGLLVLDLVEKALHSAWHAARARLPKARDRSRARSLPRIGAPSHV